mmetsp:Transcript_117078/g.250180  ORF Transcript_117078/g.250180 Transcript_117078/m.250180 type:complete len:221 (+) Transcript_117078:112-774(+)
MATNTPTARSRVHFRGRPRAETDQNARPKPRTAAITMVTNRFRWAVRIIRSRARRAEVSSAPTVRMLSRTCMIVSRCAARSLRTPTPMSSDSSACCRACSSLAELLSRSSVLCIALCCSGPHPAPAPASPPPGPPDKRSSRRRCSSLAVSSSLRRPATSRDHSWSRLSHSCRAAAPLPAPDSSRRNCTCTCRRFDSISSKARSAPFASSDQAPQGASRTA